MNNIEEKLWEYIDGNCSADEQKAIALLIEQDETYREKYLELLTFNSEMAAIEPDEPSMAFTYNVMETIRTEHAQKPLKATVNPYIIKAIGGFFVFIIAALLIFILINVNWSAGGSGITVPAFKLPEIKNLLTGGVLQGFIFFDVVLLLFLFDGFLRRRNVVKAS